MSIISTDSENFLVGSQDQKQILKINDNYFDSNMDLESEISLKDDSVPQKTSFWTCLVIFCQMGLGIGVFAIPRTFNYLSFLYGCIFLLIFAIINLYTLNLLSFVTSRYKEFNYSKLVQMILGKNYAVIYNLSIIFSCFCTIIAFIDTSKPILKLKYIVYELLALVIYEFFYISSDDYPTGQDFLDNSLLSYYGIKALIILGLGLVIFTPIALKKEIGKMAIFSYLGVLSLLYVFIVSYFKSSNIRS